MLEGRKVRLRVIEERDLERIVKWRNHPNNRRFFFSPFLLSAGGQKAWFEQLLADRNRMVFMIDTIDGKPVGMIAIENIDWRNQSAEGGQFVFDPAERRYGYAEEAIRLVITYAFDELNMNRLYCYLYSFDLTIEMIKLYGFKVEGVLRQAAFAGGKFQDKVLMSLLKEEWETDKRRRAVEGPTWIYEDGILVQRDEKRAQGILR